MVEAKKIAEEKYPEGEIQRAAPFGDDLFVFVIFGEKDSIEREMDPYFSINRRTKEFKEFSILEETTPLEILDIFSKEGVENDEIKHSGVIGMRWV